MGKEICVFCGERLGLLGDNFAMIANTKQPACKTCAKVLKESSELELCHRLLSSGRAMELETLKARAEQLACAEQARPKCLRCGSNMRFARKRRVEGTSLPLPLIEEVWVVTPVKCEQCGKVELYEPEFIEGNEDLNCLYSLDTGEGVAWY